MRPKVYIETSIVSYLTAKPSKSLVVSAISYWFVNGGTNKATSSNFTCLNSLSMKLAVEMLQWLENDRI